MNTDLFQISVGAVCFALLGCSDPASSEAGSNGTSGNGPSGTGGSESSFPDGPADGGETASGGASATAGSQNAGGTTNATGGMNGECVVGPTLSGGTDYCSNGLGDLGNGYSYEIWMDSGQDTGNNCGLFYGEDAAFRATWDLGSGGDFLARAGRFFGSTEVHADIGTISADYAFTKPQDNGFSWVAVYGWTFEPLTEYYIVEDWSEARPATNYEFQGTITIDGGTYDIFRNYREGAASPAGPSEDFDQYWSIRREPRQCGHVSISAHFDEWNSLGMEMGLLRESMLLVEALNGSGTVDFSSATVQVD